MLEERKGILFNKCGNMMHEFTYRLNLSSENVLERPFIPLKRIKLSLTYMKNGPAASASFLAKTDKCASM